MPYGIRITNGKNVTIIDENTPCASYASNDYLLEKESDFTPYYNPEPTIMEYSLPAIYLDSNIQNISMIPNGETNGLQMGYTSRFRIGSYSGIPPSYVYRRIIPFSERSQSSDTYGMRIFDGSGKLMFDSGISLATPTWSGTIRLGQQLTVPANSWFMPLGCLMYRDNTWLTNCGIERVSGNTWVGYKDQFGDIGPTGSNIVAYGMFFEGL